MQNKIKGSPIGLWKVTTEGDCEGRTTKNLGVHEGHIVDIAKKLSGEAYYVLRFENSKEAAPAKLKPACAYVEISLSISTGTWDMPSVEREEAFKKWLSKSPAKNTDYSIHRGNYFASIGLRFKV